MRSFFLSIIIGSTILLSSCQTIEDDSINKNKLKAIDKFELMSSSVVIVANQEKKIHGSGIVWGVDTIVTSYHVVDKMEKVYIKLKYDEKYYECRVLGAVKSKDVAVLKIIEPPFGLIRTKRFKGDIKRGDTVFALGHPNGLEYTLSKGIISAVRNDFKTRFSKFNAIQVDAAINPGNSGGAIFNENGELVGMSSFIITKSGMSHSLNFGIHISSLEKCAYDAIYAEDTEDILRGKELDNKQQRFDESILIIPNEKNNKI